MKANFEPVSEDLETVLEEFSRRYGDWEKYYIGIAWRVKDNVRSIFAEEYVAEYYPDGMIKNRYKKNVATLTKLEE